MHLTRRSYVLVMLTAVIAIAGIWSSDRTLERVWRVPAALLLLGLAIDGLRVRRLQPQVRIATAVPAFLGRAQPGAFVFTNSAARALAFEYAPLTPPGFEAAGAVRRVTLPPAAALAWWSFTLQPQAACVVAPDTLRGPARARGLAAGARVRRVIGAGQELYQLRGYARGDPLTRIDWKATARSGALVSRDYSEDQHLDVLVAIDAGRLSRVRAGPLDRLGVYSNVAARFAEIVTHNDDRIGLVVYAERVHARCPPGRGLRAVAALRQALAQLAVQPAESDPMAAAVSIRNLLRQRALVVRSEERRVG